MAEAPAGRPAARPAALLLLLLALAGAQAQLTLPGSGPVRTGASAAAAAGGAATEHRRPPYSPGRPWSRHWQHSYQHHSYFNWHHQRPCPPYRPPFPDGGDSRDGRCL